MRLVSPEDDKIGVDRVSTPYSTRPVWSATDPVSRLGLATAVLLIAAKVGGDVASRAKQPSVLGELVAGILLGSLPFSFFRDLRADSTIDVLARVGALLLLFAVGLESTVREVMRVGLPALRVAVLGIAGTLLTGSIAARVAMPGSSLFVQVFVAAAIAATSIGISARVLRDAGVSKSREATTVLGAAVLDDILGLVVLAVMSSALVRKDVAVSPASVAWLVARTMGFLALALFAGVRLTPFLFRAASRLRTDGALVAAGLSLCFVLAWVSDLVGLAPIVGAFAAGLILEESHSARFVARGERSLRERIEPIASWLVPIFFVLMGMRADLRALLDPATAGLVLALSVAAVVGKLACAAGASAGTDRLTVAFGMVPRGEVCLVFANLGLSPIVDGRSLLDHRQYSALVTVVVVTALATPPALRWSLRRQRGVVPST